MTEHPTSRLPFAARLRRFRFRKLHFWDAFSLIWLVWLAYPVAAFLSGPHPPLHAALFWGSLVAFVLVYVRTFTGEDERWAYAGWGAALGMFLLGWWLSGPSSLAFLVYGSSLIGWQRHRHVALAGAGVNLLIMLGVILLGPGEAGDLIFSLFAVIVAVANNATFTQLLARRRLAQVQREKEQLAANAERERIARDLHDLLGHTLSVIVLKSELAGKLAAVNPARAAEEIREVERISREALQEVRSAVRGYRGSGFQAELARAKVALDTAGVKLDMTDTLPELPGELEASAAMLLREAVTNIVRHARATEVRMTLVRTPSGSSGPAGFTLTLHDNGIGGEAPEGTGLNSMRERLRAIGGTLDRDGQRGTRLVAFFPDVPSPASAGPVVGLRGEVL